MFAAINYMRSHLEGAEVEDLDAFAVTLKRLMYGNAAAKSAIDMAVHDLVARRRRVSLVELLGGARRERTPVLWMLAGSETAADKAEGAAKAAEGFVAFKVKVGLKGPADRALRDLERAGEVRAALGVKARISADANQGYSREEGISFSRGARRAGLDFIEQLVSADDLEGMQAIVRAGEVPVGADEGIHSISDLERHHDLKAAHGGSLKILKLGGVAEVLKAGRRAEALGMQVNLAGKTAESSIGSAAIAHLAAALPQVNWDVSVTNQYLAEDIAQNPIHIWEGHVAPPSGPGLGIEVDEERIRRLSYSPVAA
jgi:muconate cycloisomerase